MVSKIYSMGLYGMEAFPVEVEADLSQGLPAFELVGLPDAAVKESRDRVRSALKNCGFDFPVSRITMNLAPADKKKEGPIYDLPLLVSLLKASRQLLAHGGRRLPGGAFPLWGAAAHSGPCWPMADKAGRLGGRSQILWGLSDANTMEEVREKAFSLIGQIQYIPAATVNHGSRRTAFWILTDFPTGNCTS